MFIAALQGRLRQGGRPVHGMRAAADDQLADSLCDAADNCCGHSLDGPGMHSDFTNTICGFSCALQLKSVVGSRTAAAQLLLTLSRVEYRLRLSRSASALQGNMSSGLDEKGTAVVIKIALNYLQVSAQQCTAEQTAVSTAARRNQL